MIKKSENTKPQAHTEKEEDKSISLESKEEKTSRTEELEKKVTELNDQLLRTLAELENTRKRASEETEKTLKYAISKFATDLIPVMENFYLAMDSAPKEEFEKSEKLKGFYQGIEMTQKEMNKAFEKHGIQRIYPLGEEFNHDLHQAVSRIPSEEREGTVVDVLQAGYVINDRLLRPALVVVATAKS